MKNLLFLLTLVSSMAIMGCAKNLDDPGVAAFDWRKSTPDEIAAHYVATYSVTDAVVTYDVDRAWLTEQEFAAACPTLTKGNVFDEHTLRCAIPVGENSDVLKMTADERLRYLLDRIPHNRNTTETELESIARKSTGNPNINGSGAFWDASPGLYAQTVAQLGTTVDPGVPNNYYNAGTSANKITLQDVTRAANGLFNTSFNSTIEILLLECELPVSGDNCLVKAIVQYEGVEYYYSNFPNPVNLDDDPLNDVPELGPLVTDPVPGGVNLVGPMPGGITQVDVTNIVVSSTSS